jgi:oligopeptide transport system substrate-binding protein
VRVNVRRPGLGDPRMRLALARSLDRQAIAEKILRGGQAPAFSFTPPGIGGYAPEPAQQRDAEGARRLLAQAAPAGPPPLALLYNTSDVHREVAEAIQEMWRRDLGITVSLVNMELKSVEEARRAGTYDLLLSSWIADYADPSAFLEVWRSDSGDNFTGWSSKEFDSILFRAARAADPAERNSLYQGAERLLLGDAPVIPLYHYTHVFLIRPSVKGWQPTLLDHHPYKYVRLGD